MSARKKSEVDQMAPIRWIPREEFTAHFDSLSSDDRWSNPQYPNQTMIWHWEERRWWAMEEVS